MEARLGEKLHGLTATALSATNRGNGTEPSACTRLGSARAGKHAAPRDVAVGGHVITVGRGDNCVGERGARAATLVERLEVRVVAQLCGELRGSQATVGSVCEGGSRRCGIAG